MHANESTVLSDKQVLYRDLRGRFASMVEGERDGLANMANMAALLYSDLPDLNWAGFYILRGSELVLGPFQGKVACVRIAVGRGVCGSAAARRSTVIVADVHAFPGHIACDLSSLSEIVVPLITNEQLLGVLDLDSPLPGRFDQADAAGLESLVELFLRASDLRQL